ncbi:MAG TPA: MFS transporter, partial [Chloroflexi bacterium]|nr:MFS transporter [Chloroflexota bacterium]
MNRRHVPPAHTETGVRMLLFVLIRTTVNTPFRIIYPFLPSIARGLGVSLAAAGGLVTLRLIGYMSAPFLGPLADRYGRRRVMEVALLLLVIASLSLVASEGLIAAAGAFILFGIGKGIYDPALHAYLGDTVPYQVRGKAVGVVELSWSIAWLVGVPASGFLIERFGWRAPWYVLATIGLLGIVFTRVGMPMDVRRPAAKSERPLVIATFKTWGDLLRRRPVIVLLATSISITAAIEVFLIAYGAWIEGTFALSPSVLGGTSAVIGVSEALAEISAAGFTDRLGKRRSVSISLVGLTASLAALPFLSQFGLLPTMLNVALVMFSFEFGLVSLLVMATE